MTVMQRKRKWKRKQKVLKLSKFHWKRKQIVSVETQIETIDRLTNILPKPSGNEKGNKMETEMETTTLYELLG